MKRNIFDYQRPHVVGGKKRNRQALNLKRLLAVVLVSILVLTLTIGGVSLYGPFNFRLKKADYYMLFLLRASTIGEVEVASAAVSTAGGAGYVINNGEFLVTAFVYKRESDAGVVRERMLTDYPAAEVADYGLKRTKVKRFDSRAEEKKLKKLLNYPQALADTVIGFVFSLDSFESTESGVMLQLEQHKEDLKVKSEEAAALYGRQVHVMAAKLTADFYAEIYQSLSGISILTQTDKKLTHKLKSFACETVYKNYLLRSKLALL